MKIFIKLLILFFISINNSFAGFTAQEIINKVDKQSKKFIHQNLKFRC